MEKKITDYLKKYIDITEELEESLAEVNIIKEFPKGKILLTEGEICNECYFIIKGLIRSFYLKDDGEEISTDFFWEENVVSPSCYGTETPSKINLDCLEDTIAYVGTPLFEEKMYTQYPQLAAMSLVIGEKIMSVYKDDFDDFKMASPEQRYLNLIDKKPGLIQRVPQYQLASYLGMKPESLSRIRKRISRK